MDIKVSLETFPSNSLYFKSRGNDCCFPFFSLLVLFSAFLFPPLKCLFSCRNYSSCYKPCEPTKAMSPESQHSSSPLISLTYPHAVCMLFVNSNLIVCGHLLNSVITKMLVLHYIVRYCVRVLSHCIRCCRHLDALFLFV